MGGVELEEGREGGIDRGMRERGERERGRYIVGKGERKADTSICFYPAAARDWWHARVTEGGGRNKVV